MQRMICIPVDQYNHMMESYSKVTEELSLLEEQLEHNEKRCIMLLLSVSSDQELTDMLQEGCWSGKVITCVEEEMQRRENAA